MLIYDAFFQPSWQAENARVTASVSLMLTVWTSCASVGRLSTTTGLTRINQLLLRYVILALEVSLSLLYVVTKEQKALTLLDEIAENRSRWIWSRRIEKSLDKD